MYQWTTVGDEPVDEQCRLVPIRWPGVGALATCQFAGTSEQWLSSCGNEGNTQPHSIIYSNCK